ncbi:WbqC family protein, partial [Crocinitomicaceae bacterium]|nr:WbqC family protein [Crocinitomicaceae bacterium]
SSEIEKNNELSGENKILDICFQLGATNYINTIGGKDLYDIKKFKEKNINLHFIQSENLEYKQFKNEYIAWLSIIDVIMFNSIEDTNELLSKFELV